VDYFEEQLRDILDRKIQRAIGRGLELDHFYDEEIVSLWRAQ
jgi:hypothetical protein